MDEPRILAELERAIHAGDVAGTLRAIAAIPEDSPAWAEFAAALERSDAQARALLVSSLARECARLLALADAFGKIAATLEVIDVANNAGRSRCSR